MSFVKCARAVRCSKLPVKMADLHHIATYLYCRISKMLVGAGQVHVGYAVTGCTIYIFLRAYTVLNLGARLTLTIP